MLLCLRNQILISLIININNLLINIDINNINNNYFDVVQLLVSFFSAFTETPLIVVREILKRKDRTGLDYHKFVGLVLLSRVTLKFLKPCEGLIEIIENGISLFLSSSA